MPPHRARPRGWARTLGGCGVKRPRPGEQEVGIALASFEPLVVDLLVLIRLGDHRALDVVRAVRSRQQDVDVAAVRQRRVEDDRPCVVVLGEGERAGFGRGLDESRPELPQLARPGGEPRSCLDGIRCRMVPNQPDVAVEQRDRVRAPWGDRPDEQRRPLRLLEIGLSLDPRSLLLEVVIGQDGRDRAAGRQPVHHGLERVDQRQCALTDDVTGGHGRIVRDLVRFRPQRHICSCSCPGGSPGPRSGWSPNESPARTRRGLHGPTRPLCRQGRCASRP